MAQHSKQKQSSVPSTSLFPFFPDALKSLRLGYLIAGLYFVVMLFLGLRYHVVGDYNVETDFYWGYVPEAKKILSGSILIEDFRGPGYPMFLALVGIFTQDFFHAGIILSTLAASVTLFFAFETLKRLFRPDIAFVGTLLVAVNPTFVQYSYTAGTDMVFNALVTGTIFYFLKMEDRRWPHLATAAVLSACAYLTRYNGVYIVLAAPAALILANPLHLEMRERLRVTALFLGIFLLAISPWGIYCLIEKGSFFYNRNYLNIAYEMFAKGRIGWDQYWTVEAHKFGSLAQVVFADPGLFLQTIFRNVFEHFTSDLGKLLGWHIGVFSVAGIYFMAKEKPAAPQFSFFLFGASFFAVLLLVFYGERFSMYLLPLYVALALKSLTWPRFTKYRFWNRLQSGGLIALVLLIWSAGESYSFNKMNIDSGPKEVVVIADWFKRNVPPSTGQQIVIARKPHIAYYLGMQMEFFPTVSTMGELLAKAREVDARYLYFSLMEAGMRPQFQHLLDFSQAPPELKPLTYTVSPPAVLYEIKLQEEQ